MSAAGGGFSTAKPCSKSYSGSPALERGFRTDQLLASVCPAGAGQLTAVSKVIGASK